MSGAIRSRTVQKGHDPREFALVAFGGGGPMQAAEVAESLGIPEVIVPPYPGHHLRDGPPDERPQVRPDAHRLHDRGRDRQRAARPRPRGGGRGAARAAPGGRRRGRRDRGRGRARLPLRRPGLRAADPAAGGALHAGGARGVPPPARAGVRPRVPRPDRDRQPARDGVRQAAADRAAAGERERRRPAARRGRERLRRHGATRRATTSARCLPVGESIDGAAVVFQRDTTTVVPPGWTARADASGSLILSR